MILPKSYLTQLVCFEDHKIEKPELCFVKYSIIYKFQKFNWAHWSYCEKIWKNEILCEKILACNDDERNLYNLYCEWFFEWVASMKFSDFSQKHDKKRKYISAMRTVRSDSYCAFWFCSFALCNTICVICFINFPVSFSCKKNEVWDPLLEPWWRYSTEKLFLKSFFIYVNAFKL